MFEGLLSIPKGIYFGIKHELALPTFRSHLSKIVIGSVRARIAACDLVIRRGGS
jgi:hypothetical protein